MIGESLSFFDSCGYLLSLAAAAAEKAAAGGAVENGSQTGAEALPQQQPTSLVQNSKSKSEKVSHKSGDNKGSHISSAFAQQAQRQQLQQQQPCIKLSMENIKLKMEPTSSTEKDKTCDHNNQQQLVNFISSSNTNTNANNIISSNHNNNHNLAGTTTVSLDSSFQDLGLLLGGDGSNIIGMGGDGIGNAMSQNDMVLPHLVRETVHHHPQPQLQQNISGNNSNASSIPVTPMMDNRTTMLDCGLSPEEICQAFHLIYVDGIGAVTGGNSNLLSFSDQDSFGKVKSYIFISLNVFVTSY